MIDGATTTTVEGSYTREVPLFAGSPSTTVLEVFVLAGPRVIQRSFQDLPRQHSPASLAKGYLQGVRIQPSAGVVKNEAFVFPEFGESEWRDEDELELSEAHHPLESPSRRYAEAIALLDEWLSDDSGYDEATWPSLKEEIDRSRTSRRRRFGA